MRLLLKEPVAKLGSIGDIIEVADGYGRNYLLPAGIAVPVTVENIRNLEMKKLELLEKERDKREAIEAIGDELVKESITIAMQASEEGHLYGSVSPQIISEYLDAKGFSIPPKAILLDSPIKELGVYPLRIRLHPDVEVQVEVWVVEDTDLGI